jgi:SAM-dependent methyltransferase
MKMNRWLIETATKMICRLSAKRKLILMPIEGTVKINLGCGLAITKGWQNIDGSLNALIAGWPRGLHRIAYRMTGAKQYYSQEEYCRLLGEHNFIHHDLGYGIPIHDNIADFFYSSHFLEHLPRKQGEVLLREAYRVLKPGGMLRVCVPDLEYALSLYASGEKEKMLENYFFIDDDESHYARHKYMYDFDMLQDILRNIGFEKITRCGFQTGTVPDIVTLDNRPEDTLFVEAQK